jgi:C1A family cysteine protease
MVDGGCMIESAVEALVEFGCCEEQLHPYVTEAVNKKPPPYCYSEAKKHRVIDAMSLKIDLNEMKACLYEGYPFIFGIALFASFGQAARNGGLVPIPNSEEFRSDAHGWHAMLAVGYTDSAQCFIVRNSWGEKWVSF